MPTTTPRKTERIEPVLEAVRIVWELLPDFRLRQLLDAFEVGFYTEEPELISKMSDGLPAMLPRPPFGPDAADVAAVQDRLRDIRDRLAVWD